MSQRYDLDQHVRRVIQRAASSHNRRREKSGQMRLFEPQEYVGRSVPQPRCESKGLVVEDETLFSRAVLAGLARVVGRPLHRRHEFERHQGAAPAS